MSSREQIQMKEESQDQQDQQRQGCTAAEVLVKCLEKEGVKYAFGIPGEENLDMMNALSRELRSWQTCMDGLPEKQVCASRH